MAMPKLASKLCQLGMVINVLYLIGWVVALVGLALSQDWCKDNDQLLDNLEQQNGRPTYTFLSHERGRACRALYRFPWFIWVLSTLPVILSVGHIVKPNIVRRGSAALAAVLAALQMIATDTFHNLAQSDLADSIKKVERGNLICVAGFATLAAMSLLMILLESLMGDRHHDKDAVHHEGRRDEAGGKVVGHNEPVVKV